MLVLKTQTAYTTAVMLW